MPLDVLAIRQEFPALGVARNGRPPIFFDNPGGTQVHESVIQAMTQYLIRSNSNTHGAFATSRETDEVIAEARQALGDFLGCDPDEVVFGPNMTSLAFHLSRSLARTLRPDDEVVVTRLDHDANIAPWRAMAEDAGARLLWAEIHPEDCTLDMEDLRSKIGPKTRFVAIGYASNATGTVNDVVTVVRWAREVQALSFVDAVHFAPHRPIDVRAIGCDFLACSNYKFFGPHIGHLYGRREHLERLRPYKVRPAEDRPPWRWETGTQNHEAMAGATAAVNYLASLGPRFSSVSPEAPRRERLERGWELLCDHEARIGDRLLDGLASIPGIRVFGITAPARRDSRVPTVVLRKEGTSPGSLAEKLAAENVYCYHGNFYALELSERLGVEEGGGFLRIGLAHYNTVEEVDRCLEILVKA